MKKSKNILIVTQYFYPENFKSNDLAFELQKRGYTVTVLTGLPNYPEGKFYDGYGVFKKKTDIIDGVKVVRTLLLPRGKGGGLRLFLNYYSWVFFASMKAFFMGLNNKYDAVIVHATSPIMQFYPALVIKKLTEVPVYLWVLDLWPESLEVAGGIKNKFVLNYFQKITVNFYKNSEKILVSSKGMMKSIMEKGDFASKLVYFPNWAEDTILDGKIDYPLPNLPDGFRIMFAGNVGEAQDLESIMQAFLLLKDHKEIKLIIIGDGRKMSFVKEFIKNNQLDDTVFCFGRYPLEAMSSFFDKADIMLVSLKDSFIFNLTVPSRVQAYMGARKPILAMLNGDGSEIIKEANAGFTVPVSNYKLLADKILEISKLSKIELENKGKSAKKFFNENYRMENCISNLEKIMGFLPTK